MEATAENLQKLSDLLVQSLSPQAEIRRAAGKSLEDTQTQEGLLLLVLSLVTTEQADPIVRQSAAVHFKNAIKKHWNDVSIQYC